MLDIIITVMIFVICGLIAIWLAGSIVIDSILIVKDWIMESIVKRYFPKHYYYDWEEEEQQTSSFSFAKFTYPIMEERLLQEEIMMNVVVKHIVEIAGGLVLGGLMSDGVNKAIEVSKKVVKKVKKK